jgi:transglutaminase-like putative cysteine protease
MYFRIEHCTLYRYDAPVNFGPHILRLNPRVEGGRIAFHELTVTPVPVERVDFVDPFGNRLTRVVFDGPADALRIESRFELETRTSIDPPSAVERLSPLPWPAPPVSDGLEAYRREPVPDASVRAFAEELAARVAYAPGAFLSALNDDLYSHIDRGIRSEGAALPASMTLATRRGACRDITVLFMAACRALGVPARFVSGYQARRQTPDGLRHLHAWAEVYLPGLGWRGFDATQGVAVTDGHVALCAGPEQSVTMPVEGSFMGVARTSTLDVSVRIATE